VDQGLPEVAIAAARFLAIALPPAAARLKIAAPPGVISTGLNELVRTMQFEGPLPSFTAQQWQVVVVLLLKALSMERLPALRESFETREGVRRLGAALGELAFTAEEFYAALELLCEAEGESGLEV
jgi:hypothetical protein